MKPLQLVQLEAKLQAAITENDPEQLIHLLEQQGEHLLASAHMDKIRKWLKPLGNAEIMRNPFLTLLEAWCALLAGDTHRTRSFLAQVSKQPYPNGNQPVQITGHIMAMRALMASNQGNFIQATEQATSALKNLPQTAYWVRGPLGYIQAVSLFYRGQLDSAASLLIEVEQQGLQSDNFYATVITQNLQARIKRVQGKLDQAQQIIHSSQQYCAALTQDKVPLAAYIDLEQVRVLFDRWQLQPADTLLHKTLPILKQLNVTESYIPALLLQVRIKHALKEHHSAAEILLEAKQIADQHVYADHFFELRGALAFQALSQGKTALCRNTLPKLAGLMENPQPHHYIAALAHSVLLITEKNYSQAASTLSTFQDMAQNFGLWEYHIEFSLLLCLVQIRTKLHSSATETLESTIARAQPEGLIRPFATRPWLLELKPKLSAEAQAFLECIDYPTPKTPLLSKRELEVLALAAQGLSNQALADQLHVSLGTIKTHIHHILAKLEADNRTAAVDSARKKGLL